MNLINSDYYNTFHYKFAIVIYFIAKRYMKGDCMKMREDKNEREGESKRGRLLYWRLAIYTCSISCVVARYIHSETDH